MSIGKNTVSGEQLRGFVERVERIIDSWVGSTGQNK